LPASKALSKYSRNRRRNSLESTRTDKKRPAGRKSTGVRLGESPLLGMTQCRWGMKKWLVLTDARERLRAIEAD